MAVVAFLGSILVAGIVGACIAIAVARKILQ